MFSKKFEGSGHSHWLCSVHSNSKNLTIAREVLAVDTFNVITYFNVPDEFYTMNFRVWKTRASWRTYFYLLQS